MTSTSEARARGRSFKVTSAFDGTNAGVAFGGTLVQAGVGVAPVLVHTPAGDVNGVYKETPFIPITGFPVSNVTGGGFDNGYLGTFNGTVIDILVAPAFIVGTGLGTTGPYLYYGFAKN